MGFPIQRPPALSLFSGSPELIAAYHVFHRLLAPRHPPYALSSLTINSSGNSWFVTRDSFFCDSLITIHDSPNHNDAIIPSSIFNCQRTSYQTLSSDGNCLRLTPHLILVEMSGFEPPTPCVQGRCSPAELHPRPNLLGQI